MQFLSFLMLFFSSMVSAGQMTASALLSADARGMNPMLSTATFYKSGGTATQIEKVTMIYFTSNDCSSGPYLPASSTLDASPALTIPSNGYISLNATSTYKAAISGTPGTTTGIQSVLVGLGNLNATFATFTGSCASTGGYCCLPITCNTDTQT